MPKGEEMPPLSPSPVASSWAGLGLPAENLRAKASTGFMISMARIMAGLHVSSPLRVIRCCSV